MKELTLIKELDQGDDVIQCDAGGIQQVLVALIVNAIEATSRGGKITIRTDCHSEKERIRMMVTDSGNGIPDDVLPHIFEPLFSTKAKNTGLGLSLVYGIVEQHAGIIDVKSKVDEGTTFTIILPRASSKEEKHDNLTLSTLMRRNNRDRLQS
jgi:signal transduction histidine kinase